MLSVARLVKKSYICKRECKVRSEAPLALEVPGCPEN